MRIWTLVAVALLAVAAVSMAVAADSMVVAADGSRALGEPVAAETGSTYDVGTTLAFDVEGGNATYELRTSEGLLVAQFRASDGTVVADTGPLDPGPYVLIHAGTDERLYEFTLTRDGTPTLSLTSTPSPTPTPKPVTAEEGTTYEVGTWLRFDVEGGDYELRTGDGVLVAQVRAPDGSAVVDTSSLDRGSYRLVAAASGETVYGFRVTPQGSPSGATGTATGATHAPTITISPTATGDPTPSGPPDDSLTPSGSPDDSLTPSGTTTTAPGFGLFAALVAGLVALLLVARWFR